jgi:hypothetical protein
MIEPTLLAFFAFFTLTTLVVIAGLYLLKKKQRMSYLGAAYMTSIFFKMALFAMFFYSFLSEIEHLSKAERAQPLLPLFMGLFAEVLMVIKLVKDTEK